jgi:hypothetical protein
MIWGDKNQMVLVEDTNAINHIALMIFAKAFFILNLLLFSIIHEHIYLNEFLNVN